MQAHEIRTIARSRQVAINALGEADFNGPPSLLNVKASSVNKLIIELAKAYPQEPVRLMTMAYWGRLDGDVAHELVRLYELELNNAARQGVSR